MGMVHYRKIKKGAAAPSYSKLYLYRNKILKYELNEKFGFNSEIIPT